MRMYTGSSMLGPGCIYRFVCIDGVLFVVADETEYRLLSPDTENVVSTQMATVGFDMVTTHVDWLRTMMKFVGVGRVTEILRQFQMHTHRGAHKIVTPAMLFGCAMHMQMPDWKRDDSGICRTPSHLIMEYAEMFSDIPIVVSGSGELSEYANRS